MTLLLQMTVLVPWVDQEYLAAFVVALAEDSEFRRSIERTTGMASNAPRAHRPRHGREGPLTAGERGRLMPVLISWATLTTFN